MNAKKDYLPYNRQSINKADIKAVEEALQADLITRGERTEQFEKDLAAYVGAEYAVAFNSGTSALFGAVFAAGVQKGDRILSTPNTFVSTVGTATHFGATPIFVDIDRSTGLMDLNAIADNINPETTRSKTVVMPVHFAGLPVDIYAIEQMIERPETVIIEDAAHALGSEYIQGGKVGSCQWSDMAIFSFHPVKNITTGEGGAVTTNRKDYYEKLKLCRANGIKKGFDDPWYYECEALTGNLHLTDFQAALGSEQLKRLNSFITKRRELVRKYRKLFKDVEEVRLLTDAYDDLTAFHLFVVQIDFAALGLTRTQFMQKLEDEGIGSQYHYIPVYRHPAFKKACGDISDYFPEMEAYYKQALSLPLFVDMKESDVQRVADSVKKIIDSTKVKN